MTAVTNPTPGTDWTSAAVACQAGSLATACLIWVSRAVIALVNQARWASMLARTTPVCCARRCCSSARVATSTARRHVYPYAYACTAGVARQSGINSGCTEIYTPWGDAVAGEA